MALFPLPFFFSPHPGIIGVFFLRSKIFSFLSLFFPFFPARRRGLKNWPRGLVVSFEGLQYFFSTLFVHVPLFFLFFFPSSLSSWVGPEAKGEPSHPGAISGDESGREGFLGCAPLFLFIFFRRYSFSFSFFPFFFSKVRDTRRGGQPHASHVPTVPWTGVSFFFSPSFF